MARIRILVIVAVLMAWAAPAQSSWVMEKLRGGVQTLKDVAQSVYNSPTVTTIKDIGQSAYDGLTDTFTDAYGVAQNLYDTIPSSFFEYFSNNFGSCVRPDPWPLSDIQPEFHIYSRNGSMDVTISDERALADLVLDLEELGWLLNPSRSVIFLVHGYLGYTPIATWLTQVKDELLMAEDALLVMVEWSKGANVFYNYGQSASNTQTVAWALAKFTRAILDSKTFKGNKDLLYIHCIGHSLGAHICGQAGRYSGNGIFDRATGLDPAGPAFENCTDGMNINVDSAVCVDNIHTDGTRDGHWNPVVPYFGTLKPWGHLDFYPNGGGNQVGCGNNDLPPCSHSRVNKLFAYTIQKGPKGCLANSMCKEAKCVKSSQPFGYYSSCHKSYKNKIPGSYYLATGTDKPYC